MHRDNADLAGYNNCKLHNRNIKFSLLRFHNFIYFSYVRSICNSHYIVCISLRKCSLSVFRSKYIVSSIKICLLFIRMNANNDIIIIFRDAIIFISSIDLREENESFSFSIKQWNYFDCFYTSTACAFLHTLREFTDFVSGKCLLSFIGFDSVVDFFK